MKKLAIIGVLGLIVPSFAFASFDRSLRYGMNGNDVSDLQDILVESNCLKVSPTGYFGLLTLKAVQCWQTQNDLPSTGFFGIMSRNTANSLIADITASSTVAANEEASTTPQTPPTQTVVAPYNNNQIILRNNQPINSQDNQTAGSAAPVVITNNVPERMTSYTDVISFVTTKNQNGRGINIKNNINDDAYLPVASLNYSISSNDFTDQELAQITRTVIATPHWTSDTQDNYFLPAGLEKNIIISLSNVPHAGKITVTYNSIGNAVVNKSSKTYTFSSVLPVSEDLTF